jgi:hypothetical protein
VALPLAPLAPLASLASLVISIRSRTPNFGRRASSQASLPSQAPRMAMRRVNWLVKRIAKEGRRSAARQF